MSVAVLHDEPEDALGPPGREVIADRRSEVVQVHEELVNAELLEQGVDGVGQVRERVLVLVDAWRGGEPEPREVGGHDPTHLADGRAHLSEAVRGAREAVQQQHTWPVSGAGLAIEHLEPVNHHGAVARPFGCAHVVAPAFVMLRRSGRPLLTRTPVRGHHRAKSTRESPQLLAFFDIWSRQCSSTRSCFARALRPGILDLRATRTAAQSGGPRHPAALPAADTAPRALWRSVHVASVAHPTTGACRRSGAGRGLTFDPG